MPVPSAPTSLVVTPGNTQLSIAFTAGASNGNVITNYKYSLNDLAYNTFATQITTSPVVITGLTNGTSYTVALKAINATGDGVASTTTAAYTPYSLQDIIVKERKLDTELTSYSTAYYKYLAGDTTQPNLPDNNNLKTAITNMKTVLPNPGNNLDHPSNTEYDASYKELKTNYSELVKMRNELDRKLADLYGAEDSVSNMYKSQLDSTIYASLLWSTLATTLIYYIFVQM